MTLSPLEYLFKQFNSDLFPDLFHPIWIAAAALLIVQVILYNLRSRQLHRHEPLVTMQEWLLWTGIAVFGLVLVMAVFSWYFFFVLLTLAIGVATYLWIRFRRFPPMIEAYNMQLRRARFFSAAKYKHPEATVRPARKTRGGRANKRRR
ncbi:MAG: hypothetical protein H0W07_09760 [Chloroflexi bacterium]|nr:hypothetical protein [Chloroflexota bacterium]